MKKVVLLLFVACVTLTANAQFYVGGSTSLWYNGASDETTFTLLPEVGYVFSDKWSFGAEVGYTHYGNTNGIVLGPYARFTYFKKGMIGLFVDGAIDYAWSKGQYGNGINGLQIGVKPGLALSLNDKFSLVTKFGFLGFRNDYIPAGQLGNGGGFDFSGNSLSLGFYYSF